MANTKKNLSDLTLLDRFLFAEAVEDPEIMQLILEIILEREVRLDGLPQTEKEERDSPRYRHVRLDVWARDLDNRVYDTEVQKRNTGNLPRRSRYYQSHIDVQLLHFMEHTNEAPPADGECEKVQRLRKKIEAIKSNEEVGVRFMQEWEERELERIDARKEGEKLGKQRGLMLGEQNKLRNLVQKKLAKNQSLEKIAEDLMEDLETIQEIADNLSGK